MVALHPPAAPDVDRRALVEKAAVAERLAELGVRHQRADAAVDVELRVAARVAAVGHGQLNQRLALRVNRLGHRGEQVTALGKGHRPQRGAAVRARKVEGRAQVEPLRVARREGRVRGGVEQRRGLAAARLPTTREVTRECLHGCLA